MTNGCGDENMRLVVNVVKGRLVVVENADVVYVGAFVVLNVENLIGGCLVVVTTGMNGDFVVIFGGVYLVVVVPVKVKRIE